MIEYIVVVNGGLEGIAFPDMVYAKGQGPVTVKHKLGERIEVESIPQQFFEASLKHGSLRKAIENKIVEVRDSSDPKQGSPEDKSKKKDGGKDSKKDPLAEFTQTPRNKAKLIAREDGSQLYGNPEDTKEDFSKTGATEADVNKSKEQNPKAKKEVKNKEFFAKPFLDQIKSVKTCDDSKLLQGIYEESDSRQLRNNISRRLANLNKK